MAGLGVHRRRTVAGGGLRRGERHAARHPPRQHVDVRRRQLALGRHLQVVGGVVDGLEQQALGRRVEVDDRAGVAALEHVGPAGELEAALDLRLAAVAVQAVGLENRQDFLLVERGVVRRGGPGERGA